MGLAKAIKRGASALLIGSMMTGLFTGCSATGENSGGKLVKIAVCVSDQTPAAQALADVFKPMVEETLTGGLTLRSQLSHFMPCSTPSFTAGRLVPHRSLENKDFFDRRFDNPCNINRQFK